ncbi:MAG: heme ABC transporter permease [Rickettsia endosymbiont of Pseudomimeciton antennatum]|nr:heme ABC transporter permease [Rickettsia endosymbiont of Pseudomimeciton antennatum]MCC8397840.1 heme ABC transporter permease [Rickettsia endosymbiont of Labidopullus appendiculatus]
MLKLLNPYFFSKLVRTMLPLLLVSMLVIMGLGLYQALIISPPDYQQGDMVRIMYVHVPSSWMALGIYTFIAICSLSNLVWKTKMSFLMAVAAAPIGAVFCMISMVTGALWGKPIWGTWWVWDARLTSMFVLFLLYLSYIVVVNSGDRISRTEKPASVIALIGFINVPIVKFSVNIWYSLHQPASVLRLGSPTIDNSMLLPLVLMFISSILYFLLVLGLRSCVLIAKFKEYENL